MTIDEEKELFNWKIEQARKDKEENLESWTVAIFIAIFIVISFFGLLKLLADICG